MTFLKSAGRAGQMFGAYICALAASTRDARSATASGPNAKASCRSGGAAWPIEYAIDRSPTQLYPRLVLAGGRLTFIFSSSGSAKKSTACARAAAIRSRGTPCPVTRKKPISVQASSIRRATSRFSATLPPRSGARSIAGIAFSAVMVQPSTLCSSFDHLAGDCEKLRRNLEAERIGSPQIDDELDFRGLRNRHIIRRFSLQNARRACTHATIRVVQVASIAHQPACPREIAIGSHRGYRMAG